MPLSERTIEEMKAGAAALAAHAGQHGISPAYMEAMIRTQERAKWLVSLEKEGRIKIVKQARYRTNVKEDATRTEVFVGDNKFTDESAELTGAFPSEVLVAQVAMALAAGEDIKKEEKDGQ